MLKIKINYMKKILFVSRFLFIVLLICTIKASSSFQGDNLSVTACAATAPPLGEPSGFAKNGLASPNRGGGKNEVFDGGVFPG